MQLSKGFWQTYKESPADAEIASHQLMMRAGFIHKTAAGIYSYLPMMNRVLHISQRYWNTDFIFNQWPFPVGGYIACTPGRCTTAVVDEDSDAAGTDSPSMVIIEPLSWYPPFNPGNFN